VDEGKENTQMNWAAALILIAGIPLYLLVWKGSDWAQISLKVYLCTACVFVTLLVFLERRSLRKRWLWVGLIFLLPLHAALMYGLIRFNKAFPGIDRVPRAPYGALVPLVALETGVLYALIELFRPKKKENSSLPKSTGSDS